MSGQWIRYPIKNAVESHSNTRQYVPMTEFVDWALRGSSKYYKAPWSTLKQAVVKASGHFDAGCKDLKKLEVGIIRRTFCLSSELQLRLAKYVLLVQERGSGVTSFQVRILACSLSQKHGTTEGSDSGGCHWDSSTLSPCTLLPVTHGKWGLLAGRHALPSPHRVHFSEPWN
jgi:hypothetical protein